MFIHARILGGSKIFKIEVNEFPSFKSSIDFESTATLSIQEHPEIGYSKQENVYYFKSQITEINKQYLVGAGVTLRILPGQKLSFSKKAQFVVNGNIELNGDTNNEIVIESSSEIAVICLDNAKMFCSNVVLVKASSFLSCQNAEVNMQNCVLADVSSDFVHSNFSKINFSKCQFGSVNCIGRFDQSLVYMNEIQAKNGKICFVSNASVVQLNSCVLSNYEELCEANHISKIAVWSSKIQNMSNLGQLDNGTLFKSYGSKFEKCNGKFILDKKTYEPLAKSEQIFFKSDISNINS
jgi:hypothetical protein